MKLGCLVAMINQTGVRKELSWIGFDGVIGETRWSWCAVLFIGGSHGFGLTNIRVLVI